MKPPILSLVIALAGTLYCAALDVGDVMVVGYDTTTPDSVSFVTWVELSANETITIVDAEYTGGGDGSGEGTGGGAYEKVDTMVWTNGGTPIAPGTVIVVNDDGSASMGSASGDLALNLGGEQFFLVQGTFNGSGNLIGDLLFGVDFEGDVGWGGSGESELPGALNVPNGNLSFGDLNIREFSGARSGSPLTIYPAQIASTANWSAAGSSLSAEAFVEEVVPPPVVPDELGQVSEGLLFHPRRMNGKLPILDETWSLAQGAGSSNADNLNGPSCIRLPSWLASGSRAHPSAVYYLYFADHSGNYIRMAWAAELEGPWTGFRMDESTYPNRGDRGVLSLGSDDEIDVGEGIVVDGHIASPDVFVDDANQQFVMYYHGPASQGGSDKGQSTVVATSSDGLNFNMPSAAGGDSRAGQNGHGSLSVILGESYFRVFEEAGNHYAFSNTGDIWASPDPANPLSPPEGYDFGRNYWLRGPKPFTNETESRGWDNWGESNGDLRPRHFGVLKRDGIVYAFLTNKAASPERIQVSTFDFADLPADYNSWKGDFPSQELMKPDEVWEGAMLPLGISDAGSSSNPTRQLRDPAILEDSDGKTYLFYSGAGEKGIGIAQIVSSPVISGSTEVTTGEVHTFTVSTDVDVNPATLRISHAAPVEVDFDAEEGGAPFIYSGNDGYSVVQAATVDQGSQSYQLAHFNTEDSETLTFPDRYYARPGATFEFSSRLRSSTGAQFAEVQVSFDGTLWQTIWIKKGGSSQGSFSRVSVDIGGLVGRAFNLRFRYRHDPVRSGGIQSGAGSGTGWFIDEVVATGLEAVTPVSQAEFSDTSFSLEDITPLIGPFLTTGTIMEDRFLLSVEGLHSGTGFSESVGYGKPFVIRVRDSYEDFQDDYFTEAERANPLISGELADPDDDGLVNLLEHAFGSGPKQAGGAPISIDGGTSPTIHFNWNPAAGYRYQLQMGAGLDDFEDIDFVENVVPNGELLEVGLTAAPSVSVPEERAFFRVKVE